MSKKWVEREGRRWTREGIITEEQYERIVGLYSNETKGIGLLPVLGSLLVGLGVLSFVAANWQELSEWFRIALILVAMLGFYGSGQRLYNRGSEVLGVSLIGIGLFAFGAGIVLIGQMFHLIAYHAGSLIVWGIAAVLLAHLYRSRYLYTVAFAILMGAQMYSISGFHTFSYAGLAALLLGLGSYVVRTKDAYAVWFAALGAVIQSLMLILHEDWRAGWFVLPLLLLYAFGDHVRSAAVRQALQFVPAASAFAFSALIVAIASPYGRDWTEELRPEAAIFVPLLLIAAAAALYRKWKTGRLAAAPELLLFAPCLYAPPLAGSLLYLIAMFGASLSLLLRGYDSGDRLRINAGTAAFLFTTMTAYAKLTWSFMDKSLFFILGGMLLFGLSWFLNLRRRQALKRERKDDL